jgi:hypothetical protein
MKYKIYDISKSDNPFKVLTNILPKSKNPNRLIQSFNKMLEYQLGDSKPKQESKPEEPPITSDHPPCIDCGGIFFLKTGTCHVCQTCGASQGCS